MDEDDGEPVLNGLAGSVALEVAVAKDAGAICGVNEDLLDFRWQGEFWPPTEVAGDCLGVGVGQSKARTEIGYFVGHGNPLLTGRL